MQALILFILFGFLAAVVGNMVGQASETTQALMQQQVAAQTRTFRDVATVVTQRLTPQNYELPGSGATTNPGQYLCNRPELRQLVTCQTIGGALVAVDQWGAPVQGYLVRATRAIYANGTRSVTYAGGSVARTGNVGVYTMQVPVSVLLLVSAGPDGKLDARLADQLAALPGPGDAVHNVAAIAAFRTPTGDTNRDSTDDIVLAISDQPAQERTLAGLQTGLNRIASTALRNYQGQFNQFAGSTLPNVYQNQFDVGEINQTVINNAMQQWRGTTGDANLPTFTDKSLNQLGADQDVDAIQRIAPSSNGQLQVNYSGNRETLNFWLGANTAMPWVVPAPNCAAAIPVNCMHVAFDS